MFQLLCINALKPINVYHKCRGYICTSFIKKPESRLKLLHQVNMQENDTDHKNIQNTKQVTGFRSRRWGKNMLIQCQIATEHLITREVVTWM